MEPEQLFKILMEKVEYRASEEETIMLEKAYKYASEGNEGRKRLSGEAYVTHPLNVALILAEMETPMETVILGILHDCHEYDLSIGEEAIRADFGNAYYEKIHRINQLNFSEDIMKEADLAVEEELILVKLADRLHNMQTLKYLDPSRWSEKADETLQIFSPLAEAIGNKSLKAKLDGLSIPIIRGDHP